MPLAGMYFCRPCRAGFVTKGNGSVSQSACRSPSFERRCGGGGGVRLLVVNVVSVKSGCVYIFALCCVVCICMLIL